MELSHSGGWACKAAEDMEEAGKCSQLGRVNFEAFESNSTSVYSMRLRLTTCSRLCQAEHVTARLLHLNWISSSSPMWMPGQEGPCDISWYTIHLSIHGTTNLLPSFMTLFQIGNISKNGNEYYSDFYDLFQLSLFFSSERLLSLTDLSKVSEKSRFYFFFFFPAEGRVFCWLQSSEAEPM